MSDRNSSASNDFLIEVSGLHRSYGSVKAVDGVSFKVRRGEVLGYLGPNGAGKTTTMRALTGLIQPDRGEIIVKGINIREQPLAVKRMIGYVPESGAIYEKLTPIEYLSMVGDLFKLPRKEAQLKIDTFLRCFDLNDHRNQRMNTFSRGMKQKVLLAAALIHNPEVILLDEPLNGLDANAALLVKGVIRRLADLGKAVVYSSHILDIVEKICDRVAILDKGRIVAEGSVEQLRQMTRARSLESVFKQLTLGRDIDDVAEAFTRAVVGEF